MDRRGFIRVMGAAAAASTPLSYLGAQQAFPTRPITFIMGLPPGSGTDLFGRTLAEIASGVLGQKVIVENRLGAAGALGPGNMGRTASPDGYTVAHMSAGVFRLPHMQKVGWDPLTDFTWIIHTVGFTFGNVVRADSPIKTFDDLISYARKNPGELSYGSPGGGSALHLCMEQIAEHAGVKFNHIPFKGTSEAVLAIEGGHIMSLAGGTDFWPLVEAGKLRVLAFWTENRNPRLPDVPTLRELGYPFVVDAPAGIAGPRGIPPDIVAKLHDAFKIALDDPKTIEVMRKYDIQRRYMNPSDYQKFAEESFHSQGVLLKKFGPKPE